MAEQHTGGMIALVPSDADLDRLAVDGGDPRDELHLTLAYLGDDVTGWTPEQTAAVRDIAQGLARAHDPVQAEAFAHAAFNPNSPDKDPCAVYLVNGDFELRKGLHYALTDHVDIPDPYPTFVPHVTAGYDLDVAALTYTGPVTFDRVRLALGDNVTDYPLAREETTDMPDQTMADLAANGIPITIPVMAVEGLPTSDGRYIEPGALTHRPLPISILAQTETPVGGGGHDGAEIIGRVDKLERVPGPTVISKVTGQPFPDGTFVWVGSGYVDPDAKGTQLAQKRYLTGNSVDLSEVEAFIEDDPDYIPEDNPEGVKLGGRSGERMRLTRGVISATTLVAIPAFADGYVSLDGQTLTPDDALVAAAQPVPSWRSAELGDDTCVPCALAAAGMPDALTASADIDALPPIGWFRDPELPGPTPLTVSPDGRVYGHLAEWGTCHTSYANACILPPKSASDYAYFRTGAKRVRDDDGEPAQVNIGKLTVVLNTDKVGHAPSELGAMPAAAHYDNAGCAVADVEIGEDTHGIWVAGAVRPTATQEQVDALMASTLSGDWRPVNGRLELVAALGVNTPGFPIPRARVASGQVVSLVAAGAVRRDLPARDEALADAIAAKVAAKLGITLTTPVTETQTSALAGRRAAVLADLMAADLDTRRRAVLAAWELDELAAWDEFGFDPADEELARRNWVSKAGGLPKYIKRIAKHLKAKGMDESRAIATAVNAAKKMCATGDVSWPGKQQVNPGSKAEACAAVADWEAKRAKS